MTNGEILKIRLYHLKGELQDFFDTLVENKCPDATLVAYVSSSLLTCQSLFDKYFSESK